MLSTSDTQLKNAFKKLTESLVESESALLNYMRAIQISVKECNPKIRSFDGLDTERRRLARDFQQSTSHNLSSVSGMQTLLLKRAKLVNEYALLAHMPRIVSDFLKHDCTDFSACAKSIERALLKNTNTGRSVSKSVRRICRYCTEKAELRHSLPDPRKNTLWISPPLRKQGRKQVRGVMKSRTKKRRGAQRSRRRKR